VKRRRREVEEANGVGVWPGVEMIIERSTAEVELVAVMDILGDVPGFGAIRFRVKALGHSPQI